MTTRNLNRCIYHRPHNYCTLVLGCCDLDAPGCKPRFPSPECNVIVVTRHPALVEYLLDKGIIDDDTPVLTHVTDPVTLRGKNVVGVLPLHLAAVCATVSVVPLDLGPEDRGKELPVERIREVASKLVVYEINELDETGNPVTPDILAAAKKALPLFLVVETSPGKLSILPAAPGRNPERTAKGFGYVVLAHCGTMEEAVQFLGEELGRI